MSTRSSLRRMRERTAYTMHTLLAAAVVSSILGAPALADYSGGTFEIVDVGAPDGYTTYRIYATFDDPDDKLLAFSANTLVNPIFFETNITLLNDGGKAAGLKQEDFALQPVSAAWDSYVTIDSEQAAGNDTDYQPGFLGGDGVHAVIVGRTWVKVDNGGWFDSDPGTPALAGDDLRVLIAQFTVEEEADGSSDITLIGTVDWQPGPGELFCEPFAITTDPVFGACCLADGSCDFVLPGECVALGGVFQGAGVFCADVVCDGACCLSNGQCVETGEGDCADIGGNYRGDGVDCADAGCTGACCLADGDCVESGADGCAHMGGVYEGDGTTCGATECLGACCLSDGACVVTDTDGCQAMGGVYVGPGIECAMANCLGACCVGDGTCIEGVSPDACAEAGGGFEGVGNACDMSVCDGACCLPDGSCAMTGLAGCMSLGGAYHGKGTDCATEECSGACCMADGSCTELGPTGCIAAGGSFRGIGTECATQDCLGACCLPDETCVETGSVGCVDLGGIYQGDGTMCGPMSCIGACCLQDGTCIGSSEDSCADANGVFQGNQTTCGTALCLGACCLLDGGCDQLGGEECASQDGVFRGLDTECVLDTCSGACCMSETECWFTPPLCCFAAGGVFHGPDTICDLVDCTLSPAPIAAMEIVDLGAPLGAVTYRFYACSEEPDAQLLGFGADPAANSIFFETGIGIVNDEDSAIAGLALEDIAQQPLTAPWDSFVTIGRDAALGNETECAPGFLDGDGVASVITGSTWRQDEGPGWYDADPGTPERVGEDGRILIAQLTVWADENGASDATLVGTVTWRFEDGREISQPYEISASGVRLAGACCYDDGACAADMAPELCASTGGAFQGPLSDCTEMLCDGACCFPSNACMTWVGLRGCEQNDGSFEGYGTTCTAGLCPCVADLDADGAVGFNDLLVALFSWGPCDNCSADLDRDGVVGLADIVIILGHWGECT